MILETVIAQLALYCPMFANPAAGAGLANVAGAAEFKNLEQITSLPLPCAFVLPMSDEPEDPVSLNAVRQHMVDSFAVVVCIDNRIDEKGQSGVVSVHTARAQIWKALLGWRPDSTYNGIFYQGGSLLSVDRSRLWYQFEFGAPMEISPSDGFEETTSLPALPHFDGATIKVDAIAPENDPNLGKPGQPDGRVEQTVVVPPTGTLP